MIIDYSQFPIFEMFDKGMIDVKSLRHFKEDYTVSKFKKYESVYDLERKSLLLPFCFKHRAIIKKALSVCKNNVVYITASRLSDMACDEDEIKTTPTSEFNVCFLYTDVSKTKHSILCYEKGSDVVGIHIMQQAVVGVYLFDRVNELNRLQKWESKHFDQVEQLSNFLAVFSLASKYTLYLKDEIAVFGKVLSPNKSIRIPNEITPFVNKTKTNITILN